MKIGVLALQGAFIEHIHMLSGMGVEAIDVRLPGELDGLDGLILPGGESTTIGKLAVTYGFVDALRSFGQDETDLGDLCRCNITGQGNSPSSTIACIDGYRNRSKRFRSTGG